MFVSVPIRVRCPRTLKTSTSYYLRSEIDTYWSTTWCRSWWGNDEREQTLNQLLIRNGWFEGNEGVVLQKSQMF